MDIAIIFGLVLLNGVFAMSEIAIVSSRQVRLQQAIDKGSEGARVALQLMHEPTRFLSTIQVGITLIGIFAGAYGEASLARRFENWLLQVDSLAPYAESLSTVLMVVCVTYLSLIFGELVPKRLALLNPEAIATIMARPMNMLSRIARPLVVLLSLSTEGILKLLHARKRDEPPIIEEEIHSLVRQGTAAGVLEESEQVMIKNVLRLDDQRVGNIMTLRRDVFYVDIEDSIEENRRKIAGSHYSRIPVCKGGLDNVIGILYAKDMLNRVLADQPLDLTALVKRPLFIPRYATALQLLEQFKKSKIHLAMVVDEHGQTSGLVSTNDVLEAIVGDLPAEDEEYEPDFVEREDGSWLVAGQVDIGAFKEHFDIKRLPEEEQGNYHTLGGLILTVLGQVPRVADTIELGNVRLEVIDMDGNRVDKVLVTSLAPFGADTAESQTPPDRPG